jgi:hypothetical protein
VRLREGIALLFVIGCGDHSAAVFEDANGDAAGAMCGNGIVDDNETCDPPESCESCDDGNLAPKTS